MLRAREGLYPTTIEADEALLEKGGLGERERMAVVVRVGEKRILKGAREGLEAVVAGQGEGSKRGREAEDAEGGKKARVGK